MSTDKKVNVTVQIPPDLLEVVDEQAHKLDLNRSQYLRRLIREDLVKHPLPGRQLELQEKAA